MQSFGGKPGASVERAINRLRDLNSLGDIAVQSLSTRFLDESGNFLVHLGLTTLELSLAKIKQNHLTSVLRHTKEHKIGKAPKRWKTKQNTGLEFLKCCSPIVVFFKHLSFTSASTTIVFGNQESNYVNSIRHQPVDCNEQHFRNVVFEKMTKFGTKPNNLSSKHFVPEKVTIVQTQPLKELKISNRY